MNKSLLAACAATCLFGVAGASLAQTYNENFDSPLGQWTTGWFYQHTNAENYYVTSGNCDPDNRGNNSCGLWITDSRGCSSGGIGGPVCSIEFDPSFGATIQSIAFDLSTYVEHELKIYDMNGQLVLDVPSVVVTSDVCAGARYSATSGNGISKVVMDSSNLGGSQIEGNTAWDNIEVVAGGGGLFLSVGGTCPGSVNVSWSNATPNKTMGILFAVSTGSFTIPGGPCSGTQLGLSSSGLRLVNTVNSGSGSGNVNGNAGTSACGHYLQLVVVDGSPCTTSNVDDIP